MNGILQKFILLALLVFCIGMMCGCDTASTYVNMLGEESAQQAQDFADGETISGSINVRSSLAEGTLAFCNTMKSLTVIMAPGSFILGLLGVILFRKTVWIRKGCIFILMLAVPIGLVVLTYGSAFLASWFLT